MQTATKTGAGKKTRAQGKRLGGVPEQCRQKVSYLGDKGRGKEHKKKRRKRRSWKGVGSNKNPVLRTLRAKKKKPAWESVKALEGALKCPMGGRWEQGAQSREKNKKSGVEGRSGGDSLLAVVPLRPSATKRPKSRELKWGGKKFRKVTAPGGWGGGGVGVVKAPDHLRRETGSTWSSKAKTKNTKVSGEKVGIGGAQRPWSIEQLLSKRQSRLINIGSPGQGVEHCQSSRKGGQGSRNRLRTGTFITLVQKNPIS